MFACQRRNTGTLLTLAGALFVAAAKSQAAPEAIDGRTGSTRSRCCGLADPGAAAWPSTAVAAGHPRSADPGVAIA